MRRLRAVAVVALCALALSSCTLVSPTPRPQSIARVPFGLLNKTIPGTNGARVKFATQAIFIVDAAQHLAPSGRIVPAPPSLQTVIQQLLLGPTAIELSAGYSSALPKKLVLISATLSRHVGYLDFATTITSTTPAEELLAVGQLVLTAAAVGASGGVVIEVAGVAQSLPLPGGGHAKVVSARNYVTLLNN